ncbi:MAG: sulfatase-like hydrolase/transferase, partial [Planctomycetota bacterium]
MDRPPNILYVMTDQQRFDTIAALGNERIWTPNLDRLVRRGLSFDRAYSTCPVCVPARWTIRSGREPYSTRCFGNGLEAVRPDDPQHMHERCGPYLAERLRQL